VALAAIVATLVSGLGGRGAPPSSMLLKVTAKDPVEDGSDFSVTISHNGGDDLQLKDLTVKAISADGLNILTKSPVASTGTLTVGDSITITSWDNVAPLAGFDSGSIITVTVIHDPSKQKLFSSNSIVVQ